MLQQTRFDGGGGTDRSGLSSFSKLRREAESVARALAATVVAREARGMLPFAELEQLRRAQLLQLPVPQEAGGPGGNWVDALAVTRILSNADGSIGQLVGYHYLNIVIAELIGTSAQVSSLYRGLLREAWFLGDSVNPLDPNLTVVDAGDHFVLDGRKTFATGAAIADRILIAFVIRDATHFAIIPRDRQGIVVNDDWDNLGQRLTASGSVGFDRTRVGRDEVLGSSAGTSREAPPRATLVPPLIQSIFVNVHLGLAAGALAAATAYTRDHSRPWFKSGVVRASEDSYTLAEYGRLAARLAASLALADQVAQTLQRALDRGGDLTAAERGAAAIESFKSKVESTSTALEITARVFELMGARSSARKYGFDRYWRDVRTLSLHDPVIYKAREVGDFIVNGRIPEVSTYS